VIDLGNWAEGSYFISGKTNGEDKQDKQEKGITKN
jgi:endogenous inhibitor of DNA gyrase (YacG/DUF329 family)